MTSVTGQVVIVNDRDMVKGPAVGAAVTNGRNVCVTDADGRFALPSPAPVYEFLSLCVPDDFAAVVPSFAQPGDGPVTFRLRRSPQPRRFRFVHITDLHLERFVGAGADDSRRFSDILREIESLDPAFVVSTGDICLQGHAEEVYFRCLQGLRVPWFHGMGNHDHITEEPDSRVRYRALAGPPYYSFDWGGWHFVILDGHRLTLQRPPGWQNVIGGVSDAELEWLEADLTAAAAPTVVFSHIPFYSTYTERRGMAHDAEPAWEIQNGGELHAVFRRHSVRLTLHGHLHENERFIIGGTEFLCTGAVCGQWWDDRLGPDNPDGSPKGYRLVEIDGDRHSSLYKSFGAPLTHQIRIDIPAPGMAVAKEIEVAVNVFDGWEGTHVEARLGNGGWQPLSLRPRVSPNANAGCAHYWRGRMPVASHLSGAQTFEVRATDHLGREFRETVPVIAGNGCAAED